MIRAPLRMRQVAQALLPVFLLATCNAQNPPPDRAFTWQEIRDKFEATNPTLAASNQASSAPSRSEDRKARRLMGRAAVTINHKKSSKFI